MSEGTRITLFGPWVAAVERFSVGREPLPFIADDLFTTSDEERTAAGIRALSELGRSTQVLLFTHHRYVVEAAVASVAAQDLRIHHLASELGHVHADQCTAA